jgi:hypothetical protein
VSRRTSVGVLALWSGAAHAAPGATTDQPAAGINIDCVINKAPVVFTTTGGTLHIVNQMNQDAAGVVHFTGTVSLQNVTATDGTNNDYSVVGASWFGGKGTDPSTSTFRSTDEFNVIGPQGKIASVHGEMTFYSDGSVKGVTLGDCAPPA